MALTPLSPERLFNDEAELAEAYGVTASNLTTLWSVILLFKNPFVDQSYLTLKGWDDELRVAGIGAICDVDFRLEFKLTDLGKRLAYDLIRVKFPREAYNAVIDAAFYMHSFG